MSSGIWIGLYCARPTFIRISVPPMASEETIDADHQADLLPVRRCADQVAGFQILRRGAGNRRRDADNAANRETPARHRRWRSSRATRNIAQVAISVAIVMPLIGIRGVADQAADARGDRDEQKSEHDHEHRRDQIGERSWSARREWA